MSDDKAIPFPTPEVEQDADVKEQAEQTKQQFDASPIAFEKMVTDAVYLYTASGLHPVNVIVCLEAVKHRIMHMLDMTQAEENEPEEKAD